MGQLRRDHASNNKNTGFIESTTHDKAKQPLVKFPRLCWLTVGEELILYILQIYMKAFLSLFCFVLFLFKDCLTSTPRSHKLSMLGGFRKSLGWVLKAHSFTLLFSHGDGCQQPKVEAPAFPTDTRSGMWRKCLGRAMEENQTSL